jgi:8-oxo-dGTP pyrophosphatase MutT (NUDIX family)
MKDLRCDDNLLRHIKTNLDMFTSLPQEQKNLKRAAVAITIVNIDHDPAIYDIPYESSWRLNAALILTRRAFRLRRHAGQWALPGGRMDAGETPEETALRELGEEVGLKLDADRIIGRLDDYVTHSGFIISPVVVWGGTEIELIPNHAEVESIHRIPMAEFLREDAPILKEMPGSDHPVLLMPIGTDCIASPTAAMIYQFREVALIGRSIRVAHFEQPFFAWQ